ncbi:MAG: DUF3800 domain-containing protein [Micrococcales bacterium]|nr:DUF3800 domain-containing protein [Micrococcales bacterium]
MDRTPPDHVGQLSRMIYIDDSGSERSGLVVYGWVEVQPAFWARALRHWLEHRKALYRDFGVLITKELHATKFINGREQISGDPPDRYTDGDVVRWKDLGRDVALRSLEALRDCPHIHVGAVYTREPAGGKVYAQAKHQAYTDLVARIDTELCEADTYGFITMDGDDPHYRAAHRTLKLDTRHLIEDPAAHDSRTSQWTQIADLVAYTAHMHLNRHHGNQFGWDWYTDHLGPRDPADGPVAL